MRDEVHCSFCDKSQRDVRRMIAARKGAHICDECVDICLSIISDLPGEMSETDGDLGPVTICALCHLPAPAATMLLVERGGALCSGCAGHVEAALAAR